MHAHMATHVFGLRMSQERYRFSYLSCKSWEPLTLHSPAVPSTTLDSLEKRADFSAAQVDMNPRLSTSTACCHPPDICCLTRTGRLVWLTVVCALMVLQATFDSCFLCCFIEEVIGERFQGPGEGNAGIVASLHTARRPQLFRS
jgi:hypothetical protein